jgi:imidazole glycerol-phosphate synthase subunit HisH
VRRVAVVDYGMGNLDSVARAFEECGADPVVATSREELERAAAIVLPGVGAFARGMQNLRSLGLEEVLHEQVLERGVPCIGLCLGMQLLLSHGEESGETSGLGWIDGSVERFRPVDGERIPHVGWNEVEPVRESPLFTGIEPGSDFYFVHSYYARPADEAVVLATTPYCGGFASVVGRGNVWGAQFHPEKSMRSGLRFLRNFLAL